MICGTGDQEYIGGMEGGRIACPVSRFVSPTFFSLRLSLPKVKKPVHQQLISCLFCHVGHLFYSRTIASDQYLSHSLLHPKNLGIILKSRFLNLHMVLSDPDGVYDVLFLAARSALWGSRYRW